MNADLKFAECCRTLGVELAAPLSEIHRAYRRLVLIWHPDRFISSPELHAEAEEKIRLVNEAYRYVLDSRPAYMESRGADARQTADRQYSMGPAEAARGLWRADRWAVVVLAVACVLIVFVFSGGLAMGGRRNLSSSVPSEGEKLLTGEMLNSGRSSPGGGLDGVPTGRSSSLLVSRRSVVIYSPSHGGQGGDPRAGFDAMFDRNASSFMTLLRDMRSGVPVQMTDAQQMDFGGQLVKASGTCGYVFFDPPRRPLHLEGIQPLDDLLEQFRIYFGGGNDAAPAATPTSVSKAPL